MNSPFTATSKLTPDDWLPVLESAPAALECAIGPGVERACIFLESSRYDRYRFQQVLVRGAPGPAEQERRIRFLEGGSVTAYRDDRADHANAEEMSPTGLSAAASVASGRARRRSEGSGGAATGMPQINPSSPILDPWPDPVPDPRVQESCRQLAEACFGLAPDATSVAVHFAEDVRRSHVVGSLGESGGRIQCLGAVTVECRLSDGRCIRAVAGGGGLQSLWNIEGLLSDLRRQLEARPAKDGTIDGAVQVVLEGGWCAGMWLHEAIGHLFEADIVLGGRSPFGAYGSSVASPGITLVDDATIPEGRVSLPFDDEGVLAGRTVLVRDGLIEAHLHSLRTAATAGTTSTGNGRRQDYRFMAIPRMTNLILEGGAESRETMVAGVRWGLLVHAIEGGSVDGHSGQFSFNVLSAHLIEGGHLGQVVSGLTLSGDSSSSLAGIVAVGSDFSLERDRGVCLKAGQRVPVGLGSPTILVEGLAARAG